MKSCNNKHFSNNLSFTFWTLHSLVPVGSSGTLIFLIKKESITFSNSLFFFFCLRQLNACTWVMIYRIAIPVRISYFWICVIQWGCVGWGKPCSRQKCPKCFSFCLLKHQKYTGAIMCSCLGWCHRQCNGGTLRMGLSVHAHILWWDLPTFIFNVFLSYFLLWGKSALSWIELLVLVIGQIMKPKRQYLLHIVIGCIPFFKISLTLLGMQICPDSLLYNMVIICFVLHLKAKGNRHWKCWGTNSYEPVHGPNSAAIVSGLCIWNLGLSFLYLILVPYSIVFSPEGVLKNLFGTVSFIGDLCCK